MLGSQEKNLEPKVNVKFFTVDPYTPFNRVSRPFLIWLIRGPKVNVKLFMVDPYTLCNRVSRPFPTWSIWQIWSLSGQKYMFFGGLVKRGHQIWIVFGQFHTFGPSELFL